MKKYKLIINDLSDHDSDVALIDNNNLICVLETERVSKHKHSVFEKADDYLVDYIKKVYNIADDELEIIKNANVKYKRHHDLHAIASFLSSGYKESSVLVIDALGDQDDAITLYYAKNNELTELKKYFTKHSLGFMYSVASGMLYGTINCEGKLMGLSCCAEPEYSIPSPIQFHEDGTVDILYDQTVSDSVDQCLATYIRKKFTYLFNNDNAPNTIKSNNFDSIINSDIYKAKIAATVQWWFTEQVINIVKYLKSLNPESENLCLCGGCFLNCETNGIIDRLGLFKNIYCVSAPADNSLVLGQAQQLLPQPKVLNTAYLGPKNNLDLRKLEEIFDVHEQPNNKLISFITSGDVSYYDEVWIIERLKNNKPILWFDGESEFGPRALGHRSFLANPATNEMFWKLSVGIKQREVYRPLAPITTDNLYNEIFDDPNPENLTQFMLKTVKVKEKWHEMLKAVIHVNQTARPQRLTKETNPVLYSLINRWYEKTGIPCLINTSLNMKNQPLLETFDDLKSFFVHPAICGKCSVVINHALCFDIQNN